MTRRSRSAGGLALNARLDDQRESLPDDLDDVRIIFDGDDDALDEALAEALLWLLDRDKKPHPLKYESSKRGRVGFVYFVRARKLIKIGFSENVAKRIRQLQTGSAQKIELLGAMPARSSDETAIHKRFHALRVSGEWFRARKRLLDFISVNAPEMP